MAEDGGAGTAGVGPNERAALGVGSGNEKDNAWAPGAAERFQESFRNRHQKEAERLRSEIEELVRRAKVLLHGQDPRSRLPPRPTGKRAERDRELEATLEKSNWYRHEIKKLRRDLESWDRVCGGPAFGAQERDPMETYNLLVERRKELQRLQRNGHGLDRVAAAQRRAEAEQNMLSPEIEDRLRRAKDEVEQHKRLNIRLQAERQKMAGARKQAEQEVRAANSELRSKVAQLQRPPRPTHPTGPSAEDKQDRQIHQLQKQVDILCEAMRQDQRKHGISERDDEQQLELSTSAVEKLKREVAAHEAEISHLRIVLRGEDPRGLLDFPHEILTPCSEGFSAGVKLSPLAAEFLPAAVPAPVEAEPEPAEDRAAEDPRIELQRIALQRIQGGSSGESEVCAVEEPAAEVANLLPSSFEPDVDTEEADDMEALVMPAQDLVTPAVQAAPAVPAEEFAQSTAALVKLAGVSLAQASISGMLPEKLDELAAR